MIKKKKKIKILVSSWSNSFLNINKDSFIFYIKCLYISYKKIQNQYIVHS